MFVWFPELIYGQMFWAFYRKFMKYQFFMIESPIIDTLVYLDIFFRISTKLLIRIDAIFSQFYIATVFDWILSKKNHYTTVGIGLGFLSCKSRYFMISPWKAQRFWPQINSRKSFWYHLKVLYNNFFSKIR